MLVFILVYIYINFFGLRYELCCRWGYMLNKIILLKTCRCVRISLLLRSYKNYVAFVFCVSALLPKSSTVVVRVYSKSCNIICILCNAFSNLWLIDIRFSVLLQSYAIMLGTRYQARNRPQYEAHHAPITQVWSPRTQTPTSFTFTYSMPARGDSHMLAAGDRTRPH